jgi:hypothetical protein
MTDDMHENEWWDHAACNDYDADEEGIGGRERIQWTGHERSFTWVRVHEQRLAVDDLVRWLVANCNVGSSDLICISQARRDGGCGRWELAIVEVEFLDPISVNEELGCFDELG